MIQIRKAREKDTLALENLFMVVRQQTFAWENSESFKIGDFKKSTEGERVFVAQKEDSEIIGFISIWEPGGSFIHNLFVCPDFQNLGIGKALLKKAVEVTLKPITMKVVTYNIKACKFYEKQGWKQIATNQEIIPPYHVYCYSVAGSRD